MTFLLSVSCDALSPWVCLHSWVCSELSVSSFCLSLASFFISSMSRHHHYIAQVDLKLTIVLFQPLNWWNYSHNPQYLNSLLVIWKTFCKVEDFKNLPLWLARIPFLWLGILLTVTCTTSYPSIINKLFTSSCWWIRSFRNLFQLTYVMWLSIVNHYKYSIVFLLYLTTIQSP